MGRFNIPANCVSVAVNFWEVQFHFQKKIRSFGGENIPVPLYELRFFFCGGGQNA